MTRSILPLAGALLLCAVPTLRAQSPPESPHDLVKDVVYNELQERRQVSLWQYREEKRVGSLTTIQQEVETRSGIVYRVLARQGRPLDPAAQKKETERLNNLLRNSAEQARMKQEAEADEQRLQRLMTAMPEAFSYTYDGMVDGNLRLLFRPNPAYTPQTYENRAYHALGGEIWIQPQLKRLVKIDAHIMTEIDFGYGLLGRIEKGAAFRSCASRLPKTAGRPAPWMFTSRVALSSSNPSARISARRARVFSRSPRILAWPGRSQS